MFSASHNHLTILFIAWIMADLGVLGLIHLSRRFSWMDHPWGHKTHREPTPILGGLGIYAAVVTSILCTMQFTDAELYRPLVGTFIGSTMVLVLGLIDDFRPINAIVKLGVLTLATLIITKFGVCVTIFPGGSGNILNILVTLLWIVGVTSSFNSLDHYNGTTAGSAAIACAMVFIMFLSSPGLHPSSWLSYVALAIVGGCAGFLRHNLNGGKIFLGDNGSFFLGFLIASMLVFTRWSEDALKSIILPCMVLTVPLFDITLSTALRIKNGIVGSIREAIVYCGKDHIAHRLAALGFGQRLTVLAVYSLGIISGISAIAIRGIDSPMAYLAIFSAYLVLLLGLGVFLDRSPVHSRPRRSDRSAPLRIQWANRPQRKRVKTAARQDTPTGV